VAQGEASGALRASAESALELSGSRWFITAQAQGKGEKSEQG